MRLIVYILAHTRDWQQAKSHKNAIQLLCVNYEINYLISLKPVLSVEVVTCSCWKYKRMHQKILN